MTGTASRTIHSGRFSDLMNALTTFSRLIAALLLLALRGADRLAQRLGLRVEIELLEQVADRLGAHAALEVDAEAVRRAEALLELAEDELVVDDLLRLELLELLPGLLEPADRLDGRLARVLAPRLDVQVHLADLQRPLDDRVEILLLHPALGLEAEVVRELADLLRRLLGDRVEQLARAARCRARAPSRGSSRRRRRRARRRRPRARRAGEQRLVDLVDVLRDRALLRAGRLVGLGDERREGLADLRSRPARRCRARAASRSRSSRIADRRTSSRIFFESSVVIWPATSHEDAADELARLLERRQRLLLGPGREAARPELVVLVEVLAPCPS